MADEKRYGSSNRRKMYDNLSNDGFDLGSFDDFNKNIEDKNVRRAIYDTAIERGWELPDYGQFERDMTVRKLNIGGKVREVSHQTYDDFMKRHPNGTTTNSGRKQAPATEPQGTQKQQQAPWGVPGGVSTRNNPAGRAVQRQHPSGDAISNHAPFRQDLTVAERAEIEANNNFGAQGVERMRQQREQEMQRRNEPLVETGSEGVDTYLTKTKGQWEDELQGGINEMSQKWIRPNVDAAMDAATEKWFDVMESPAFAAPGSDIAKLKRANESVDPEKMLKDLQASLEATYSNPEMQADIERQANALGLTKEEYAEQVLKPALEDDLVRIFDERQISQYMPKSASDFIIQGLGNSIGGMLMGAATETKSQRAYKNMAAMQTEEGSNADYTPGTVAKLAQMGVSFAADAPFFGFYGKVGGNVAKRLVERQIQKLTAKGLSEGAARNIVGAALERSVGQRMKNNIMQHVVSSSLTMGGYNATSETARQVRDSEFNPIQLATSTAEGLVTGAAFGVTGGITQALSQPLSGIRKIGAKVAGFGAEAETMYATEELAKMAHGEDGFTNPFEGSVEAVMKLGVMKVSSPEGIVKTAEGIRHPIRSNRRQQLGISFTPEEEAYIRNSVEGANFVQALSDMHAQVSRFDINGKTKRTPESEEARRRLAENYNAVMNNTEFPATLKEKIAAMSGGIYRHGLETGADIIHNADGTVTLKTRDKDGNCIQDIKFDSFTEADEWRDAHIDDFRLNDAVNMWNGASQEARANAVRRVMDEQGVDEEGAFAMIKGALNGASGVDFTNGDFLSIYDAVRESAYPDDEPHTNRSYQEGRQLSPEERRQAVVDAEEAERRLSHIDQSFANEVMDATEYPDEKILELSQRDEITGEQLEAAIDYYNKVAKANGMVDKAMQSVDERVAEANAQVRRNTHKETGNMIEVSQDGHRYYITAGQLEIGEDGVINAQRSDKTIVARDMDTGELKMLSPDRPLRVESLDDPSKVMADNDSMEGLRGRLMDEVDMQISYAEGTPAEPPVEGDYFVGQDGKRYMAISNPENGSWLKVEVDEQGNLVGERSEPLNLDEYRQAKSDEIDGKTPIEEENAETAENYAQNEGEIISEGMIAPDNTTRQDAEQTSTEDSTNQVIDANKKVEESQSATVVNSRIPMGEDGRPQYEQAAPEDTREELVGKYGEERAQRMIATMAVNTRNAFEAINDEDTSKITDMAELAEHEDRVTEAERKMLYWENMAKVSEVTEKPVEQEVENTENAENYAQNEGENIPEKAAIVSQQTERPEGKAAEAVEQQETEVKRLAEEQKQQAAEMKITQAAAKKAVGKTYENVANDGSRYVMTVKDVSRDGKTVTVDEQVIGRDGRVIREAEGKQYNVNRVGRALVDGTMKRIATKSERLVKAYKGDNNSALLVSVLTDEEQEELLAAHERTEQLRREMAADSKAFMKELQKKYKGQNFADVDVRLQFNEEMDQHAREWEEQHQLSAAIDDEKALLSRFSDEHMGDLSDAAADARSRMIGDSRGRERWEKARRAYEGTEGAELFADESPTTLREFVSQNMPRNISWEDVERGGRTLRGLASELGIREKRGIGKGKTTNAFNTYLAKKGEGISAEEAVHQMYDAADGRYDDQDIRNEMIDLFMGASKSSDISDAWINERIDQAERLVQEADERMLQEYEAYMAEAGGMRYQKVSEGNTVERVREMYAQRRRAINKSLLEAQRALIMERARLSAAEETPQEERSLFALDADLSDENKARILKPFEDAVAYYERLSATNERERLKALRDARDAERRQININFSERLEQGKSETDTEPSDAQKEAGNYKKGHISFGGYDYTIENPKGSVRRGTDASGQPWEVTMNNTYGYIRRKYGKDGDHLDMFINDDADLDSWDGTVYVVDQVNPDGSFDEHKVMYGFDSEEAAREAYLSNYSKGWKGLGKITGVDKATFDKWLDSSTRKMKPFAEHSIAKDATKETIQGLDGYTKQDVLDIVRTELERLLEENGIEGVELKGMDLHGSRMRGDARDNSDLDVVVEYGGRYSEDALFNLFNEEPITIEGITVDVNPITKGKSGTLEQYMKRSQAYDAEVMAGKGNRQKVESEPASPVSEQENALRDAVVGVMREAGVEVSTDWEEGQRVLDEANGRLMDDVKRMGTSTRKRQTEIAKTFTDTEISNEQRQVVDVFSGNVDKTSVKLTDKSDKERNIIFRQGNERKAGVRHSVFRHYQTNANGFTSEEVAMIPEIIANGDRKQDKGVRVSYRYEKGGIAYIVTTEVKGKDELFTNFYTNRKPSTVEQGTSNTENRHVQPQLTASDAKVRQNSETTKDSEIKFFRSGGDETYGFTYKGKIYIDPRIATSETPVHEYTHLWAEMKRKSAPDEWNDIKNILLNDKIVQPFIDKVKRDYPELSVSGREDDFVEEVLSQFSGRRGAERLRQAADEIAREKGGGIFGRAEAIAAVESVKRTLDKFWRGVAEMFGWKYTSAEEIADKVLSDLLSGKKPRGQNISQEGSEEGGVKSAIADLSEPGQSDAASDVSKPQTPNENGKEPINTETQLSSSENSALNNTTDTGKTPGRGKRNDTATPQSTVSEGKGKDNFPNVQENGAENLPRMQRVSRHPKVQSHVELDLFGDESRVPVEGKLKFDEDHPAVELQPLVVKGKEVDLKKMSDDELLQSIGSNDGRDRDFFLDEYDQRHRKEYGEAVDSYVEMLERDNVSLDDAYDMYGDVVRQWKAGGFRTSERCKLMGQIDALEDYVERKEAERIEREEREEEERLRREEEAEAEAEAETKPQQTEQARQYEQQKTEVRAHGYDLTKLKMRELGEGESCHVERRYTENNWFSFTGGERVESSADVAYIFRELENAGVENSFMVLVKDGVPTVIHLGIGNYASTVAPLEQAFVAAQAINPDKVWFLHNHPSGALHASRPDIDVYNKLRGIFGEKAQPAIIIDTKSGKYGEFTRDMAEEKDRPTSVEGDEIPVKVFNFSKQVFDKDWDPQTAVTGNSSAEIAAFVSSHRLGEHRKMSLLVLDQAGHITGNIFLPWTTLDEASKQKNAAQIATQVNQMGGVMCVIYGSYDADGSNKRQAIRYMDTALRAHNVRLRDILTVGESAFEKGWVGEPESEYTPMEAHDDSVAERQYEDALAKWKQRNGLPADAEAPTAADRPQHVAGEDLIEYARKLTAYQQQQALWKTAPKIEDYQNRRQEKKDIEGAMKEARKYPESQGARMKMMEAELVRLRHAVSRQRAYDKATVKAVTDFAQDFMRQGFGENLSRGEMERMLSAVKNATGARSVKKEIDKVLDILVDNHLRNLENSVWRTASVKELRQTAQGVERQGKLELKGQRMIQAFREAIGTKMTIEQMRDRLGEIAEKMSSGSEDADMWEQDYEGTSLALQYEENIGGSRQEWEDLRRQYNDAVKDYKGSGRSYEAQQQLLASIVRGMQENKLERIGLYNDLLDRLGGNIKESMEGAKEFVQREKDRISNIHRLANLDLAGKDAGAMREPTKMSRLANSTAARFFLGPLATFEQMLRQFGGRNARGEGYLYNHFMRSWIDSVDKAYVGEKAAKDELDAKAREVFGKGVKRWSDLYEVTRRMDGAEVTVVDQGVKKTYKLTQGNLMYIYMANKMTDGEMKLRGMGITEEDVAQVKEALDPRLVTLADWLQDKYLVKKRVEYNKVHERMFGAPMAAIEHYFPIRILADARYKEEDVGLPDNDLLPTTITGSIIKRRRNALPLDILNTDALSLAIEHVQDMEHWAAQAEWNRDVNTLLSYTTFRNKVKNMNTIYGSGDQLWNTFKDTAKMAAGEYRPQVKPGSTDKTVSNIAKGVTAAKISFRMYTAFKQILSAPAFLHDVDLGKFAKYSVNPYGSWKWAMENIPVFRKRWESRQAGDTRLMEDATDWKLWKEKIVQKASQWGMSPNALVDGVTCAVGARAIYESRLEKYKKMGMAEADAQKRALQDAELGYNLTQQSSEGAFVSAIQKDRTVAANMLSVFRNSSMSYTRQWVDAARNLKHRRQKGYREDSIGYMAREFEEQLGLDAEQARKAAELEYARAGRHELAKMLNMMFGVTIAWNMGASLPYLLFGDDDKTRGEMLEDAVLKGLVAGPVEGLAAGSIVSDFVGQATNESVRNAWRDEGGWGAFTQGLNNMGDQDINPLPLFADVERMVGKMKTDGYAAAQELFNICVQSAVGVNPQTATDMWNAAADYFCPGWDGTDYGYDAKNVGRAKEFCLFMMRMANAPASSWRNKYIDEFGMSADDAEKAPYDDLARRYAHYKHWKDTPMTGWLRGDDARKEKMEKIRKQFDKAVEERMDRLTGEELQRNLERSQDQDERRMVAKIIHKRILGSGQDAKKATTDYQRQYQKWMTYGDIVDAETLSARKLKAKADGDKETVKLLEKCEDRVLREKKKLIKGSESGEELMERIRAIRKEALEKTKEAGEPGSD